MNNFNSYFALYENTDPPPIITEGYKLVQDSYLNYLNPAVDSNRPQQEVRFKSYDEPSISFADYETPSEEFQPTSIGLSVVNTARQFIGGKYQWGGTSPSTGFDCSGLIYYSYKQNGVNLPRTVKEMEKVGTSVDLNQVQPGDLICLSSSGPSGKHIKMVTKVDNGQIYTIDARGKKKGIIEEPLVDTSKITTIRRISINQSNQSNYIIDYFVNKGLTRNQAKGIYGNLMQESRGNIRAVSNDGNNSYGLAQWTGPRKQKLFSMYGFNPNVKQQLDFLWWELNNTHKDALASLKRTSTVSDATRVFMNQFERPHRDYANFNKRLQYANSIT